MSDLENFKRLVYEPEIKALQEKLEFWREQAELAMKSREKGGLVIRNLTDLLKRVVSGEEVVIISTALLKEIEDVVGMRREDAQTNA